MGMDLHLPGGRVGADRFPHTRGDGPLAQRMSAPRRSFSPHPWGWTLASILSTLRLPVFPTPVGMDRHALRECQ
mgnify:CR=1 FL=1